MPTTQTFNKEFPLWTHYIISERQTDRQTDRERRRCKRSKTYIKAYGSRPDTLFAYHFKKKSLLQDLNLRKSLNRGHEVYTPPDNDRLVKVYINMELERPAVV